MALWPELNRTIGAWFKWHWNDPQPIVVKLDDPSSPINAPFKGQSFEIRDETYTYPMESWSRDKVRVLTSVDYAKMGEEDEAKEPAATRRTDGDYGLCWISREGQGRLFYEAHGHSERVYAIRPWVGASSPASSTRSATSTRTQPRARGRSRRTSDRAGLLAS